MVSSLSLSDLERRGLAWVQHLARQQLTQAKRRLKYSPRITVFEGEEVEILKALVELEKAAGRLLR